MTAVLRKQGLLILALLASGCGGSYAAVKGAVTLDGSPVETGFISFIPADQTTAGPVGRVSIAKGRYAIDPTGQLKPGPYRIEIHAPRKTGKKIAAGSPAPPGTMVDEEAEAIPEKYNKQSTLTRDLKAGDNTFDFELTTAGP